MISSQLALPPTLRSSSSLATQLPLPPRTRHNPALTSTSNLLRFSRFRTLSVTRGVPPAHAQFSCLLTRRSPKLFRIRTSIKYARNSFRMNTSKTKDLKSIRMNTSKKTGEGVPVAQASACALRSASVWAFPPFDFQLSTVDLFSGWGNEPVLPLLTTHDSLLSRTILP